VVRQIDLEGDPPAATSIYACYEHRARTFPDVFSPPQLFTISSSIKPQDILVLP
jgi:hypothetical protein